MDAGQRYGDHPMLKLGELTPVLGVVAPAAVVAAAIAAWRLSSFLPRAATHKKKQNNIR